MFTVHHPGRPNTFVNMVLTEAELPAIGEPVAVVHGFRPLTEDGQPNLVGNGHFDWKVIECPWNTRIHPTRWNTERFIRVQAEPTPGDIYSVDVKVALIPAPVSKENTMSFPRKSAKLAEVLDAAQALTNTNARRAATGKAIDAIHQAFLGAGLTPPVQTIPNLGVLLDMIRDAEDTYGVEAIARLIGAAEKEAEADELEAKGGPRRLERAEKLREYARIDRYMVEKEQSCTGCNGPLLTESWFEAHAGLCSVCEDEVTEAVITSDSAGDLAASLDPRSWEAVRQTGAFAVALDIARQERNSEIKKNQAAAALDAVTVKLPKGVEDSVYDAAHDAFSTALRFYRNDNNVLWGAARVLATLVDDDDELGALQVLRNALDRQDGGEGCPVCGAAQHHVRFGGSGKKHGYEEMACANGHTHKIHGR